jgi:hypothetical protein
MIVPVVPWNPVVLILHNLKTNRWHPILFWECPLPSGELGDGLRWKSKGHHTNGFDSRHEAIHSDDSGVMALCASQYGAKEGGEVYYDITHDVEWDGEETPAMVMMFVLSDLTKFEAPD